MKLQGVDFGKCDEHGKWNGLGDARHEYEKRHKEVKGVVLHKADGQGSWQQKGRSVHEMGCRGVGVQRKVQQ